jgi:hypothetical protein
MLEGALEVVLSDIVLRMLVIRRRCLQPHSGSVGVTTTMLRIRHCGEHSISPLEYLNDNSWPTAMLHRSSAECALSAPGSVLRFKVSRFLISRSDSPIIQSKRSPKSCILTAAYAQRYLEIRYQRCFTSTIGRPRLARPRNWAHEQ